MESLEIITERVLVLENGDLEILAVAEQGPPGPQGIPGTAGGSSYVHTQAIASMNWTVAHNLARRPSATVVDHLGNSVEPDVRYLDDNTILITHGAALIGAVYCN